MEGNVVDCGYNYVTIIIIINYIQLTISFLIDQKHTVNFQKSVPGTSSSCRLCNNHVKDTQGHA